MSPPMVDPETGETWPLSPRRVLDLLEEVRNDIEVAKEAQRGLDVALKELGRTMRLLGIEATGALVRNDDAA